MREIDKSKNKRPLGINVQGNVLYLNADKNVQEYTIFH